jgi:drug/metabolite transporter (DMT)-like permease
VLAGATLLGFSAIFVRWATAGGASILTIGLYRMLFALPGVLLLTQRAGAGGGDAAGRRWGILAGLAFAGDLALWHESMRHTSAANATLLVGGLSPIWVALFAALALGLRYRWAGWLGQAAGLAGALVLAVARGARAGSGRGEALAMAASLCYAAFTLAMSRARRTLNAPQALFWMTVSSLACFVVASVAAGDPLAGYGARGWASLVGLGLVVQLAAWWLSSWGLGHVDATLGALGLQMQQIATIFLAAWLLDEPLRPLGLAGGALIMTGIVLVASPAARRPRLPSPAPTPSPAAPPAT